MRQQRSTSRALLHVVRAPLFWQIVALVLLGLATKHWLGSREDAARTIGSLGMLAPLATVALQCAAAMTPVGSSLIPTLNGMLFPLLLAMTLNLLAGVITGVFLYYFWRHGDRAYNIHERLNALPPRARRFARTDLLSLTIMRMLPWAGANVATFLAGTCEVPLGVHVTSVIIGSLPGSILYALLGAGIVAL